jgi:hypothetical protein
MVEKQVDIGNLPKKKVGRITSLIGPVWKTENGLAGADMVS